MRDLIQRLAAYDPKLSPDNRADEADLHDSIVMATGIGSLTHAFEETFLRSIDAAVTLVPEGCGWRIWSPAADSNQRHRATIWAARGMPMFAPFDVEAASAPLALCVAALKAREQSK